MRTHVLSALFVTTIGVLIFAVPACGGNDESDKNPGTAGSGGSGGTSKAGGAGNPGTSGSGASDNNNNPDPDPDAPDKPIQCGTKTCNPVTIPAGPGSAIAACCPEGTTDTCGLDTSLLSGAGPTFEEPCQKLGQEGTKDPVCPSYSQTVQTVKIEFEGCCRKETGTCGYRVDSIAGLLQVGLGCVEAAPFTDGGAPIPCGDGSGGQGGQSGAGGSAGSAGGAAAGAAGNTAAGAGGAAGSTAGSAGTTQ